MKYLVGLSGGKDSTAAMLWVIHESGYDPQNVEFVFLPTGLEALITLEYIEFLSGYVEQAGYCPIRRVVPPLDFFELAQHKGHFPSRKKQFCTEMLKIKPLRGYIASLADEVISISGTRADESHTRIELPEWAFDKAGHHIYRPILTWSEADVFAYLRKWNVPRNPLYDMGFSRVGCFPCVNARKREIRLIAIHFPKVIDRIRLAECELGRSFYSRSFVPAHCRSWQVECNGKSWIVPSIDDVVRWSFTTRGGRQFALPRDAETLLALSKLKVR